MSEKVSIYILFLISSWTLLAQGPPPIQPLQPPPEPAGNPVTVAGTNLGTALFWDEQLSSTRTMACGTCHIPGTGGTDPRSGAAGSLNPGSDGLFNNDDDVVGSPGVPLNFDDGTYGWSTTYGLMAQVTGRKAPSALNAGYSPELFWDGRAGDTFFDPLDGTVVLSDDAALESQALGPPLSSAEMGHVNRDWEEAAAQIAQSRPLALAEEIPGALAVWIDGRTYPDLFNEAFGTSEVTPARIAMAIASYERTLYTDQTPFDDDAAGVPNALTQAERRGRNVFVQRRCAQCHQGTLLTDNDYHYIGVRPVEEDEGRFAVSGNNRDRGRLRTPGLRNVALRAPYFHNGRFDTLEEVIDFYDRGGDFDAPNKDNRIVPLRLSQGEKNDLLAFLTRPLTDPRVAAESGPFQRPTLYTESNRVPTIGVTGRAGSGGLTPRPVAFEPPLLGNPSFTLGLFNALGNTTATLVIHQSDPGIGAPPAMASFSRVEVSMAGSGAGQGYGSVSLALPEDAGLSGLPLFARWYVADGLAPGGFAVSPLVQFTPFDGAATAFCLGDVDRDGAANVVDLIQTVNAYGSCAGCSIDANGDGMVDQADVLLIAGDWQTCEP